MAQLTDAQIAGYAKGAGFSGNDVAIAVAVALAESRGRTDVVNSANRNGSTDRGLWQINSVHKALLATGDPFDPASNARMAHSVFAGSSGGSWRPWSTYNDGRYLGYLPRGRAAAGSPALAGAGGGLGIVPGGVSGSANAASDPSALLGFFTTPGLWARVGVLLLGGALLVFALWKLTGVGSTVVKGARTVVRARTGGLIR
jgi:Lysozyme like domain